MNEYIVSSNDETANKSIVEKFLVLKEAIDKQQDEEWLQEEHPEIAVFETALNDYKNVVFNS